MRTLISILWISFFPLAAAAQGDDLSYRLKKVIKDKKAEIGIAVILDAQDTVTVNNDDRYPLMSVFKFHQALAVADYLDRNGLTPDTEIFIPEEELVPDTYSPLRKEFPEGEISLSVSRLLEYSLQLSDNNVILTQTERLMMSNRPKDPKTARNKNVLVVGGSGSGKTRFFIKPNLMQLHSSYVVTDPNGYTIRG